MDKKNISFTYEIVLGFLIVFSLFANLPSVQDKFLSWFIWGLFPLDYSIRFIASKNKWQYIKTHPLELMAIIPIDQLFSSLRLIRLIRMFRLLVLFKTKTSFFNTIMERYKIDRIFVIVVVLLFLSAIPMYWIEPSFETFEDALWWTVVTTTTVGYGDLYPETTAGRIIGAVLMFLGIGLLAVVTGSLASYFSKEKQLPSELNFVREKIEHYESLTNEEIDLMIRNLEHLKEKEDNNKQA